LEHLATALEPTTHLDRWPLPIPDPPENENTEKTIHHDAPGRVIPVQLIVKPSPKKLNRGLKWRLDPRWDKLTPCAKAVYTVLCVRAKWPRNLQSFPFAWGGVGTWTKEEGEKPGSLCTQSGYTCSPVRRALLQLQGYSMIKKINRGYPEHGVSKFFVFFTPAMSAAFTAIAKNKQRIPHLKKPSSRMS
jgi:hypothetical protein